MVDCPQFLDEYSEFRDGLLSGDRMASFRAHRDACDSCARYDRVIEQGIRVFRDLPEVQPSTDFVPRLQHRLFHADEEMRLPPRHASGTSLAFLLVIVSVIGVSAWMPAVRAKPALVRLPPVMAHAPHPDEAVQVLFQPGPLLGPPAFPQGQSVPASNLLFFRYSPVGSYVAQATPVSLAH